MPDTAAPAARSGAAFLARLILGVVFIAHGWQKFDTFGVDNVAKSFEAMDVPLPTVAANYATFVELIGGAALILGLAVPIVSLLLIADMLGALWFVHLENGLFMSPGPGAAGGGYELVLTLIAGLIAVAALSVGKFGADGYIAGRRRRA